MNRNEFLAQLRQHLAKLPLSEINDIVRDQEERIHEALSSGRKEEDVIAALGSPQELAVNLIASARLDKAEKSTHFPQQAKNAFSAFLAILALAPLNFFMLLGPFLIFISLLFAAWLGVLGGGFALLTLVFVFLFKFIFLPLDIFVHLSGFFMILGVVSLGFVGVLLLYQLTKFFIEMSISYLRWNVNFIQSNLK